MALEIQDVLMNGLKTAVRVIYIDGQSRRYQADVPVAQATVSAVGAVASQLQSQASSLQPVMTPQTDQQALSAAAVQTAIQSTLNDDSPAVDPSEE